jgi:hypothetical protein
MKIMDEHHRTIHLQGCTLCGARFPVFFLRVFGKGDFIGFVKGLKCLRVVASAMMYSGLKFHSTCDFLPSR